MCWTEITRAQHCRRGLRYASDLKDAEWVLLFFFLLPRRRVGRPREVDLRAVMNAILYILSTGCQWRALPKDFPPCSIGVEVHADIEVVRLRIVIVDDRVEVLILAVAGVIVEQTAENEQIKLRAAYFNNLSR